MTRLFSLALITGLLAAVLAAVLMRGRVQIVGGVSSRDGKTPSLEEALRDAGFGSYGPL